jgi:hypothetical protein
VSNFRDAMNAGRQRAKASPWSSIVPKALFFVAGLVSIRAYQQNSRAIALAVAGGALLVACVAAIWINVRAMRSAQK